MRVVYLMKHNFFHDVDVFVAKLSQKEGHTQRNRDKEMRSTMKKIERKLKQAITNANEHEREKFQQNAMV